MACDNCACQGKTGGCTSNAATGPSVSLRKTRGGDGEGRNKLWKASASNQYGTMSSTASTAVAGASSDEEEDAERQALLSSSATTTKKCEKHNGFRGVCCRDLKQEERHLINPDIVRDVIIGLSDGLTVPFALTAGLSGVGSSRIVVVAGMAELVRVGAAAREARIIVLTLPHPLATGQWGHLDGRWWSAECPSRAVAL